MSKMTWNMKRGKDEPVADLVNLKIIYGAMGTEYTVGYAISRSAGGTCIRVVNGEGYRLRKNMAGKWDLVRVNESNMLDMPLEKVIATIPQLDDAVKILRLECDDLKRRFKAANALEIFASAFSISPSEDRKYSESDGESGIRAVERALRRSSSPDLLRLAK